MISRINQLARGLRGLNLRRGVRGAIDLASIMVGVIVIGVVGGVMAATVFQAIPWAQTEAAKASLESVRIAQSTHYAMSDRFFSHDSLYEGVYDGENGIGLTAGSGSTGRVIVDAMPDGNGYFAAVHAQSGEVIYQTSVQVAPVLSADGGIAIGAAGLGGGFAMEIPASHLPAGYPIERAETILAIVLTTDPVPAWGEIYSPETGGDVSAVPTALYVHDAASLGGSGTITGSGVLLIKNGDFVCDGLTTVPAGVIVSNGDLTVSGSCNLTGEVYASGQVAVHGSLVLDGSVTAGSLHLTGTSQVTGDVTVGGSAIVGPGTTIHGTLTEGASIVPPTTREWADVGYNAAQWPGFAEVIPSSCGFADVQAAITQGGVPVLLDARDCATFSPSLYQTLVLTSDVAIFAPAFAFSSAFDVAGSGHTLWLIVPDEIADGAPSGGGSVQLSGTVTFEPTVAIYAPGTVTIGNGVALTGQIMAGTASISGTSTLQYAAVPLPR